MKSWEGGCKGRLERVNDEVMEEDSQFKNPF